MKERHVQLIPTVEQLLTSGNPTARRFEGRTCLVTGAASGIGAACVLRFLAEGGRVVAADRDRDGLGRTLESAGATEGVTAVEVDVRSEDSVSRLAAAVNDRVGSIDVVVNNAGIEILGDVLEMAPDVWDEVMRVNLRGTYLVSRAMLPLLLAWAAQDRDASIVNNASLMGLVSSRGLAAYCASKAGVISLTRSMALDYASAGVRVNCVCPGIIHTPMLERRFALEPDRTQAYLEKMERPPVKYIGRPQDVAAAIAYLASSEARFVTGSALTIDGGVGAE
jgi:meso-butanediol dehydrogenase/(S,S)-butanediol dehydrogenase/diacetyl reductase